MGSGTRIFQNMLFLVGLGDILNQNVIVEKHKVCNEPITNVSFNWCDDHGDRHFIEVTKMPLTYEASYCDRQLNRCMIRVLTFYMDKHVSICIF